MRPFIPAVFRLFVCLLALASAGSAQVDAVVVVPFTVDFSGGLSDLPSIPDFEFSYAFTLAGGAAPPGLSLRSNGVMSGTPTTAGQYTFSVNYSISVKFAGQSLDFNQSFPFSISVTGGVGPRVSVDPGGLSFSATAGAPATAQYLSVSNQGSLPREFSATASVSSGGDWLSISGGGAIAPFGQGAVVVTANPGRLPAGTYVGSVSIAFTSGP